jgi:ATP/maltotriose-dependent transcriptional regulator MalT/DNA-binding SARP family transcriptional activator
MAEIVAAHDGDVDIVLDDFHELDGAETTLQLIDYLTLRLPPNCRLFLASRTEPMLDCWPRLSASGRTTSLTTDDLLMTSDEVRELWKAGGNDAVDDAFIARLTEVSKGWPVAVAVATRGADSRVGDLESRLSDFLGAEVIAKLPSDVRDVVEKTSALDVLSVERCQAMPGIELTAGEVESILSRLGTMNMPATVVSTAPIKVRLHPLVRELLESRLRTDDEAAFKSRHIRAAELDLKDGWVSESLAHLASAEAWEELAAAIARQAPQAYQAGRWHSIATWLGFLPGEELQRNAELSVWQARILVRLGKCDQALASIDQALSSGSDMPEDVRASLETIRSAALRTKGEIGAAVRAGEEAKRLAFAANAPVEVVAEARKELGLCVISQGAFEDGIDELQAALELHQFRGDASNVAFLSGCLGSAYGAIGRLAESVAYLEQARQMFGRARNSKELSWVLNNLGVTYWNLGSVGKARLVLTECLAAARSGAHLRIEGWALTSLAEIDRFTGALDAGRGRYEAVLAIAEEVNDATLGTLALVGLADLERRAGRYQTAETLARRAIASAESRLARSEEALARLTLARLARRLENTDEALVESAAAVSALDAAGMARELGDALLCRAEVLVDLRSHRAELTETLRRLDEVISRVGHGQFVLYSERAEEILRYAVARRISGSYNDLLRKLTLESDEPGEAPHPYPTIEVRALGTFEVKLGGRLVAPNEWESEKSRELFLLFLTSGRPMTRDAIVASLWPDGDRKRATSAFHSTLHRCRRALYPKVIVEAGGWYSLQPEGFFSSDVGRFADLTQTVDEDSSAGTEIKRLTEATATYRGPFAPSLFSEWAEELRRTLEDRSVSVALRLGQLLRAARSFQRAAEAFETVLSVDRFSEAAWYGLLMTDAALGGRERALRSYRRYEKLLHSELGEAPHGRIAAFYRQLREPRRLVS